MKSSAGVPMAKNAKSTIGQSELLASSMFFVLISTIVVAQNISYYNATHEITSGIISLEGEQNVSEIIEASRQIEVRAGSNLNLTLSGTAFYENESILVEASLRLDNSSSLQSQTVDFYVDNSFFSSITAAESELFQIEIPPGYLEPGAHEIKAVFQGAEFIEPSESSLHIEILGTEQEKAIEVAYSDLQQGEVIIGEPVNWTQEIHVYNPNDFSVYNYILVLDSPEDAKETRIDGVPVNGSTFIIKEMEPGEKRIFSLTFSTSPVEMEVINETINLSDVLPKEAFSINLIRGKRSVLRADNVSEIEGGQDILLQARPVRPRPT